MGNLLGIVVHAANIHDTKSGILAAQKACKKYPSIQAFCADAGYRGTCIDEVKVTPHNSAARWTRIFSGQAHTPARFLRRSFFGIAVELLEKMEIKVYNESRIMFSGERRTA